MKGGSPAMRINYSLRKSMDSANGSADPAHLICPTGKKIVARENLSSPLAKNIPLRRTPKSNL